MLIGYARTSTVDQVSGLEAQQTAFAATGCAAAGRHRDDGSDHHALLATLDAEAEEEDG